MSLLKMPPPPRPSLRAILLCFLAACSPSGETSDGGSKDAGGAAPPGEVIDNGLVLVSRQLNEAEASIVDGWMSGDGSTFFFQARGAVEGVDPYPGQSTLYRWREGEGLARVPAPAAVEGMSIAVAEKNRSSSASDGSGDRVVYTGIHPDALLREGVYLHDAATGEVTAISAYGTGDPDHGAQRAAISANGDVVVYMSNNEWFVNGHTGDDRTNPNEVFAYDVATGEHRWVSERTEQAGVGDFAVLSGDGSRVAFWGRGDYGFGDVGSQLYVVDLISSQVLLGSVTSDGQPLSADAQPRDPSLSADGRLLVYSARSGEGDVMPELSSGRYVFLHDLESGELVHVSEAPADGEWDEGGEAPAISADGRFVVYRTPIGQRVVRFSRDDGERLLLSRTIYGEPIGGDQTGTIAISDDGSRVLFGATATESVGYQLTSDPLETSDGWFLWEAAR